MMRQGRIVPDPPYNLDDICRTERYYTATLLPIILFHNSFQGLREFIALLMAKGTLQTLYSGKKEKIATDPNELKRIEIVTEMDIVRDVKYYANWIEGLESIAVEEGKTLRPDVVLIADDLLIVIEGKFFDGSPSATKHSEIGKQISDQRTVIEQILLKYPNYGFKGYCHLFLSQKEDIQAERIGCHAAITWQDIADLSERVLGRGHYVTHRLQRAIELYYLVLGMDKTKGSRKNYRGKKNLSSILADCKKYKDEFLVGFTGGVAKLKQKKSPDLDAYKFKWDYLSDPIGRKLPRNWIPGSTFFETIKEFYPELLEND
jgi:hypothetical protein